MTNNNGVERMGISLVLSFQAPWPAHPERYAKKEDMMRIIKRNSWVRYSISVFVLGVILLTGCGKNKRIEGKVQDAFGSPLSDVTVKIEKSAFSAKTDGSGQYSLDYAPGPIKLIFSKKGYTTRELTLNIQQKVHFPAEKMVLYPIPTENGLFYIDIDNKRLVKLDKNGTMKEREGGAKSYYIQPPKNVPTIKAGKSMFIDEVPYRINLATVNKDGLIYKGDFDILGRYDYYNGFLEDEGERVGKEKLWVRTVDLSPGLYAWVQIDEGWEDWIGAIPKKNGSAFIFRVENTGTK